MPLQHPNVTTQSLNIYSITLVLTNSAPQPASASMPQQHHHNNSPYQCQHLKVSISSCIKYPFLNTLLVPCCELSTHQDVKNCMLTIATPASNLSHLSHLHYMPTTPYHVILVFILGTAVGSACMHCHERPQLSVLALVPYYACFCT
jgi:hypothetical protein